jgi:hypothetical protein
MLQYIKDIDVLVKRELLRCHKGTGSDNKFISYRVQIELIDAIKLDEDLIKSETREAIKKHLERLMALFLASSIALSAGTVGLIYLKHKDDPKPWQVEKTGETAGTSTNAQPAVIITPTPAKNPIIPTSGEEITQYNQDLTDEDSIDERED